jgi:hypothetical protein
MLLGHIDTATSMCCYCNEISVNEGRDAHSGREARRRAVAPHVNPFNEMDRCLGSKPKFVEQGRIQPNF